VRRAGAAREVLRRVRRSDGAAPAQAVHGLQSDEPAGREVLRQLRYARPGVTAGARSARCGRGRRLSPTDRRLRRARRHARPLCGRSGARNREDACAPRSLRAPRVRAARHRGAVLDGEHRLRDGADARWPGGALTSRFMPARHWRRENVAGATKSGAEVPRSQ
jgi:hypothetical protein